ncbi:hypothetical protein SBA4_170010 [Candidatus Sulfopaludibacter sp. SbA4]|nr:hypothetical protein SBA4_170010 [Candidatus Sulfopaludibacter sp. SbA4]
MSGTSGSAHKTDASIVTFTLSLILYLFTSITSLRVSMEASLFSIISPWRVFTVIGIKVRTLPGQIPTRARSFGSSIHG